MAWIDKSIIDRVRQTAIIPILIDCYEDTSGFLRVVLTYYSKTINGRFWMTVLER